MEDLSLENILDDEGLSLFSDNESEPEENIQDDSENSEESENNNEKNTAEIDPDNLFGDSESVGSEEDNEEQEDATPEKSNSSSPKSDFFSSIAEAFAEEGILPNLDEKTIKGIKNSEDFRKVIDDYIKSELDEQQQRIKEALDDGVAVDVIKNHENVLSSLESINNDFLEQESEEAEKVRKTLIYQDYINRGFSDARARKELDKSIQNGTDIEDAREALQSNIDYYKKSYNTYMQQAKAKREAEAYAEIEKKENFKKTIFADDAKFLGELTLDKNTKQQVLDNISKPVFKDPESGTYLTAIQRYESEHPDEFLVNLGLVYTLTDGFKSLDKLVNKKVKKEVKKGFRNLEDKINNSSRDSFGSLMFTSGVSDDNSYIGKGLKLAL